MSATDKLPDGEKEKASKMDDPRVIEWQEYEELLKCSARYEQLQIIVEEREKLQKRIAG